MKTKLLIVFTFCTFNLFSQTNLAPNGGFETWTNSTTLSNWTIKNNVTQNTSNFTEGSKSAQLSIANSTTKPEIIAQVPMTAGKTYTVKFKYKYVTNNYSGQHPISLNISQNGSATTLSNSTFATDNNWTLKETTFTPDQNLSYDLSISLFTFDAAAFNVLIDDVQVYIQGTEQYTTIPDVNFEKKLIALGIDSGSTDGKVLTNNVNNLTSLNVSNSSIVDLTGIQDFVALTTLNCYNNKLITLDVSKNVALTSFGCNSNQLTTLDVSKNVALTSFGCNSNKLLSLNLKNGKNTLLTNANISLSGNANLTCIVVDNTTYSNTNWTSRKDTATFFSPLDCSLITKIPDAAFEDKLIVLGIDTDGKNGLVATASIAAVTTLDVSNSSIADLTGIQAFTALTTLNCSGNLLKKLDLSKNTVFSTLNCSNNPTLICIQVANVAEAGSWATTKDATASFNLDCTIFTLIPDAKFEDKLIALGIDKDGKNGKVASESITNVTYLNVCCSAIKDLTGIQDFVALKYLYCHSNELTSLDVSKNLALIDLSCETNKLTSLDVSNNVFLVSLTCDGNQISSLDVTKNIALKGLSISHFGQGSSGSGNGLFTTIDVSKNAALEYLNCQQNRLVNLDLSNNLALKELKCGQNQLTTLDVSKNTALVSLSSDSNKLLNLNLKNGKNTLFTNNNLTFSDNPNLKCIVVDDVAYSNTNWANKKDTTAFYSSYDCSTISPIPDPKFEDKLIASGIDTDGKNGVVLNSSIAAITSLDVSNSSIADLTGIQAFTALRTLNCSGNLLKKLDLSKNTVFSTLNCSNNPTLICIQVANVAEAGSWATTKDATASFNLDCTIYTLIPDAKFEDKLIALGIDKDGKNGKVTTESIASLTYLDVSNSSIADLTGIQDFKTLTLLECDSNRLASLDVSKNIALENLFCRSNQLTSLDVSKNVALTYLFCEINQLTTLDVSKNVALTNFGCYSNKLTSLDVSKNKALTRFECSYNKLQTLNLKNGKNTLITNSYISLYGNSNLYCILVDDVAYSNKNWADRKDTHAIYNNVECIPLSLPSNNFTVESKGETCTGSKNGEINITAAATYTYKASINGTSYPFINNSLKVLNLIPGTYTVSITITGETFEQSFTVIIPKAATITGKSSVVSNKVSVEITQGTAPYSVFVDGIEQFETTESSFSVETKKGGLLEVKTAKACEGIYAEAIAGLEGAVSAYPNPTSGSFEVQLPTSKKEVVIALYSLNGQLISNKTYTVENGKAQLTLENQPAGIYVAKIELDTPDYLKIIKN
jgi:hypothetical protein